MKRIWMEVIIHQKVFNFAIQNSSMWTLPQDWIFYSVSILLLFKHGSRSCCRNFEAGAYQVERQA